MDKPKDKAEIKRRAEEIWKRVPKPPSTQFNYKPLITAIAFLIVVIGLMINFYAKMKTADKGVAPQAVVDPAKTSEGEEIINIQLPRDANALDRQQEIPLPSLQEDAFAKDIDSDLRELETLKVIDCSVPSLVYIINRVKALSPEEWKKRVDPSVTIDDIMKNPSKYRGKCVRLSGGTSPREWVEHGEIRRSSEEPGQTISYVLMFNTQYLQRVLFYTAEDLPPVLASGKVVKTMNELVPIQVEGVFLRMYDYMSEGSQKIKVLLIVSKKISDAPPPAVIQLTDPMPITNVVIIVVAVVVIFLIFGAAILQRKFEGVSVRERLLKMKIESLAKGQRQSLNKPKEDILGDVLPSKNEPGPNMPSDQQKNG